MFGVIVNFIILPLTTFPMFLDNRGNMGLSPNFTSTFPDPIPEEEKKLT